jgi:hypothetical protein
VRQKLYEKKLSVSVIVTGVVGRASVWMRVSDTLPVNNMRMNKTGDTYHVTAKEYKEKNGKNPFFIMCHSVHKIITFLTAQK